MAHIDRTSRRPRRSRPPLATDRVGDQATHPAIEAALDALPASLLARSGKVFYAGRAAFSAASNLYVLGLNPGGDPLAQASETIDASRSRFRQCRASWSAYIDESWEGAPPGTWGMQPRVLHLLRCLDLDPHAVPASNVVFARTATETKLKDEKHSLLAGCWPVHRAVIEALSVRLVACFGGTAGRWVRDQLEAHDRVDGYKETNSRRWSSAAHRARDGRVVLTLTHPGRANWCNPNSDPTPLVRRMLSDIEGS